MEEKTQRLLVTISLKPCFSDDTLAQDVNICIINYLNYVEVSFLVMSFGQLAIQGLVVGLFPLYDVEQTTFSLLIWLEWFT